jgi:hypothetical protein
VSSPPGALPEETISAFRALVREELVSFSHDLIGQLSLVPPTAPHVSPERAADMVAVTIGQTGQPVQIVQHPAVRSLTGTVAPDFPLPNAPQLREAIIRVADAWRKEFNHKTEQSDYVSLMVDGARRASRRWLGVCIATAARFSFWRVIKLASTTGLAIASVVAEVIEELGKKGFSTVAIVTDNAANEVKAVRDLAETIQLPIFRIPCLSHTTNLAVHDFLQAAFRTDFWKDMHKLLAVLPRHNETDKFHGLKTQTRTRSG